MEGEKIEYDALTNQQQLQCLRALGRTKKLAEKTGEAHWVIVQFAPVNGTGEMLMSYSESHRMPKTKG